MFALVLHMPSLSRVVLSTLIAACFGLTWPSPAAAQAPTVPTPSPDFLFGRPDGSIAVRGSWVFSRAASDWYDFVGDQLTIGGGAFNAPAVGFEVGFAITPRLDVLGAIDFGKASTSSEYRDFVDENRLPITQKTELWGTNIGASLRYSLTPRGREVGTLAWVPRSVVPYVGAGGGFYYYRLRQSGDFVDFVDLSIFNDVFQSSGWTPSAHVFGGADIKLHNRLYLSAEVRYLWAAGDLDAQWIDFAPLDLAGLRISSGINVLF